MPLNANVEYLFLAGGLGSHLGGFAQTTYDGIAKTWSWDNLDLRAVAKTEINILIPELKERGATGIIELPIAKIVH